MDTTCNKIGILFPQKICSLNICIHNLDQVCQYGLSYHSTRSMQIRIKWVKHLIRSVFKFLVELRDRSNLAVCHQL